MLLFCFEFMFSMHVFMCVDILLCVYAAHCVSMVMINRLAACDISRIYHGK